MVDGPNVVDELKWEDTWLLLAVLYAARVGQPATLAEVIGTADYINHAIPTRGELDGALPRLRQQGWIHVEDLTFEPTEQAETMFADRRDRRSTVSKDLDLVRERIGALVWKPEPLPAAPSTPTVAGLTAEAVEAATTAYLKSARH
jgi:hypothetical protein